MTDEYPGEMHEMWEQEFINFILNITVPQNDDFVIIPFATRSMSDIVGGTIGGDTQLLTMGFGVVFLYILIMLGK